MAHYGKENLPHRVAYFLALRKATDPLALARTLDQAIEALNRPAGTPGPLNSKLSRSQGGLQAALAAIPSKETHHAPSPR